ncbi:hypothetical protein P0W64_14745 [Tsukamurella sp. 8F]|uniref:hypothetical protein n=1 Tax=unclassified Tsukamurella TaxID=2633480 RepID=UPI0023B93AA2|nr:MULTISPECIES: hypothetical protein [unclassified Tsukamurella]MDF0531763.1 hypothetical protein [Tsukamurella sp. 8J]MDF0588035.1 hypothetical protein [Tsukamurella sp. 8F]
MAKANKLVKQLARRGPHRVLKGDLGVAGLTGVVYTPEAGVNLPALAFAHDWLIPIKRYSRLFEHLASWGIVVAAPSTEGGPLPSDGRLAIDLGTALDIATEVRLGVGEITVNTRRRAVAGHGFGAGAALLAAGQEDVRSLAALFPAPTSPQALDAARSLELPALLLAAAGDEKSLTSNAAQLAEAYGGDARLRILPDGSARGLAEGISAAGLLGAGKAHKPTQKAVRTLLTGFVLATAGADEDYSEFAEPDTDLGDAIVWRPEDDPEPKTPSALDVIRGK